MYKTYDGVKMISCECADGVVIGEDTYAENCTFDRNVSINRRNFLVHASLGAYSHTGHNTTIKHASIGKFTSISWDVSIGGANHDYTHLTTHPFPFMKSFGIAKISGGGYKSYLEKLIIGNDVWIGSGAQIMRGIVIGDGAIVGAGAVVTKDIPPYAIAVGNPARVIKYRFSDEIIEALLKLKWWNFKEAEIREMLDYFKHPLDLTSLNEIKRQMEGR